MCQGDEQAFISCNRHFVAVSGEEQGLLGATYMANKLKKENRNVEAVLNNDIMGSNNSNETNIINNTTVRVFCEGLPAYETEKTHRLFVHLVWKTMAKQGSLHVM